MATWINDDGLAIDFGLDEARFGKVAGYRSDGDRRWVEILIEQGNLPGDTVSEAIDTKCKLPAGAIIDAVSVASQAGTFAGAGTLDIGVEYVGTGTDDTDGIFDGLTAAMLNGTAAPVAGALVGGIQLPSAAVITWTQAGAITGAGAVVALRVFYVIPKHGDASDTLIYVKP